MVSHFQALILQPTCINAQCPAQSDYWGQDPPESCLWGLRVQGWFQSLGLVVLHPGP